MRRSSWFALRSALGLAAAASTAHAQSRAAADSPAYRACNATLERAVTQVRRAARIAPRAPIVAFVSHNLCYRAGASAWMLHVERPQFRRGADGLELVDGALTITHFNASGAPVRVDPALLGAHARVADRIRAPSAQLADFDADGEDDLVLYGSPTGRQRTLVLTARGGVVRPYAGSVALEFDSLTSLTLGAQPDMVQHVKLALPEACSATLGAQRTPLSFVAVNAGGAFRADGDEARAWARWQCPERPTVIVPHHGVNASNAMQVWGEVARRAACARVWGMSAEEIARTLPTRWPDAFSCTSAAELLSFARSVRPPFVLRPMSDVRPSPASANANVQTNEYDDWVRDIDAADYAPAIRAFAAAQSRQLNASLAQVVRQTQGAISVDELQEFFSMFGRPLPGSPRDAWFNSVVRLQVVTPNDEPIVRGATRLVHVNAAGQRALGPLFDIERGYESNTLEYVVNAFDFDGDGTTEAIVRRSDVESDGASALSILTVRNGAMRAYEPAGGVPRFERVVDVDEDGRPDLVSTSTYALQFEMDSDERGSILTVAHARADGTFSTDDAAARAFVASQCTAPPERIAVTNPDNDDELDPTLTLSALVCARFYGERAERIVARLHADSRGLDEGQLEYLRTIAEAAIWRVPYQLSAPGRAAQRP